jgi:hypothetical protein
MTYENKPIVKTYQFATDYVEIGTELAHMDSNNLWMQYIKALEIMAKSGRKGYNPEFKLVMERDGHSTAYLDGVELEKWTPKSQLNDKAFEDELSAEESILEGIEALANGAIDPSFYVHTTV